MGGAEAYPRETGWSAIERGVNLYAEAAAARGEVINIGGDTPTTILELAELAQATLGVRQPLRARFVPYDALPGQYHDVRHRVPDTTKARALLGFEARVTLADGLARTADWHRKRRAQRGGRARLRRTLLLAVLLGGLCAVAPGAAPTAPAAAGATGIALDGSVELAWQPVSGATSYRVYPRRARPR